MNENSTQKKENTKSNLLILEYIVHIHINIVNDEGKMDHQSFNKIFNSTNILENRRDAIEYYLDQSNFFLNHPKIDFSSPIEAEIKNYRDFKSFSITLEISDNDENYILIHDTESLFEFLIFEATILKNHPEVTFTQIKDQEGDIYSVNKENIEFFNFLLIEFM